MLDRDRLLKISELDSDKIAQMDDNQFNSFAKTINDFIDGFPAQEADVKHALRNKNRGVLLESLIGICDMLKEINAVKLSNERLEQLSAMGNADFKDLQIFVINLLKSASALSIDLQMAECQDAGESQDEQKSLSKNNILVVDDRYFSLAFIKTMLNNTGYSVTCINSGVEAIEHLKSNCPDLCKKNRQKIRRIKFNCCSHGWRNKCRGSS